jgi:hypothetical protein
MITTLNLRSIASLEDRHFAVRDFLVEAEAGRATRATLYLIDGTPATGGYPRLVTPIDPLVDRDGSYLPDLVVLSIDLAPQWVGSARLSDINVIELDGHA